MESQVRRPDLAYRAQWWLTELTGPRRMGAAASAPHNEHIRSQVLARLPDALPGVPFVCFRLARYLENTGTEISIISSRTQRREGWCIVQGLVQCAIAVLGGVLMRSSPASWSIVAAHWPRLWPHPWPSLLRDPWHRPQEWLQLTGNSRAETRASSLLRGTDSTCALSLSLSQVASSRHRWMLQECSMRTARDTLRSGKSHLLGQSCPEKSLHAPLLPDTQCRIGRMTHCRALQEHHPERQEVR